MKDWKEQINLPIKSVIAWGRYIKLIEHAMKRGAKKTKPGSEGYVYYEAHHAWPRKHGGVDLKFNMVNLTGREHMLAHWMLKRSLRTKQMCIAFHNMVFVDRYGNRNIKRTCRLFESARIAASEASAGKNHPMYGTIRAGSDNPFYGKVHTEESRKLISESRIGKYSGANNPFYGKTHSDEVRNNIFGKNHPMYGKLGELNPMFGKRSNDIWLMAILKATDKSISINIWKRADIFYSLYKEGFTRCKMARFDGNIGNDNWYQGLERNFRKGWNPNEDSKWLEWKSSLE